MYSPIDRESLTTIAKKNPYPLSLLGFDDVVIGKDYEEDSMTYLNLSTKNQTDPGLKI